MARQKYGPGSVIWRYGKAYPATRRNRSLPRSAFSGSPKHNKISRRQQKEIGRAIGMAIMFFMWMIMFVFVAGIAIIVFSVSALLYLISFIIKIPSRIISYKIRKEKLNKVIFAHTNFEEGCINGMRKSFKIFDKGVKGIGKDIQRADKRNRKGWSGEDKGRYCEICGGRLGKGRVKYCSECRPTYRSAPFEENY